MSTITAAAVNELRKRTDMPLMDCKKALQESGGDMEKAIVWLNEQGKKFKVKRSGNETAEGRIAIYLDPATENAAIIEVRCESAPVAKSDQFIAMANDLARGVAENNPLSVDEFMGQKISATAGTASDRMNEVIALIRENMKVQRFHRAYGGTFGEYVHHDGTLGVLLQTKGKGGTAETLRDICAHIAALNPVYARTEDVPADILAKEKELALAQVQGDPKNTGKPANILEKIADGKLKTRLVEGVLTEQPMANGAKYPNTTVGAALKKAGLEPVRFVRLKVGAVAL